MANLAEELLLLAFNDRTGRNQASHLEMGLAGAVLLELSLLERIDIGDKHIEVIDSRSTGDGLLDEMIQRIQTDKPRKANAWVPRLSRNLTAQVRDRLVQAGVLEHVRDTVLAVFPFNRYQPGTGTIEADALRRLTAAVDTGHSGDARTGALASLIYILQMERVVFPDRRRRDVRAVLKTISQGSWASRATKQAVDAANAAVMSAVAAAVAASTAASAS